MVDITSSAFREPWLWRLIFIRALVSTNFDEVVGSPLTSVDNSNDGSAITSAISSGVIVDSSTRTLDTLVSPPIEVPSTHVTVRVSARSAHILVAGMVPVAVTVVAYSHLIFFTKVKDLW